MKSMTGFGRGTASRGGWDVTVQASSVNRKSLDVLLSLPREWQMLEPELAALARERMARGRLQIAFDVRGGEGAGPVWDDAAIDAVLERLEAIAQRRGLAFSPTPELLFQVANATVAQTPSLSAESALSLMREAMSPALDELVTSRTREGAALENDIRSRAARLLEIVREISRLSASTVQNYRESLLQRLRQAGLELDLGDERVLKEVALFAERIDIAEETTRLHSHLEHLVALTSSSEPVGRKCEFVLQEIGREIHTVGSKANDIEVARCVIDFKNELERIREQVQNVE